MSYEDSLHSKQMENNRCNLHSGIEDFLKKQKSVQMKYRDLVSITRL